MVYGLFGLLIVSRQILVEDLFGLANKPTNVLPSILLTISYYLISLS
jgi:hypothetical protein